MIFRRHDRLALIDAVILRQISDRIVCAIDEVQFQSENKDFHQMTEL